jgi:flavin-binding protein dodecin
MPQSVYKVIEIIGTSPKSWEEAARNAVELTGEHLRDLRVAEVVAPDLVLTKDGKVEAYRTNLTVSFKYEGGH